MNGMQIRLAPTVKLIVIACFAAFVVQQTTDLFLGGRLLPIFGLVPSGFVFEHRFWQLFTYPFLHGDVLHLFLNLMMLAFIGSDLEFLWGRRKFLLFFFVCSTFAGLLYLFLQMGVWRGDGLQTPMVGASGAIYGLLMAYGMLFGERAMLFMMLFPMKAKHFVWLLALVEFMTTAFSGRAGLSSAAHLGGMLAGLAFLYGERFWRIRTAPRLSALGQRAAAAKKKSKKSHLKLVIDNEEEDPKTWH